MDPSKSLGRRVHSAYMGYTYCIRTKYCTVHLENVVKYESTYTKGTLKIGM